MMFERMQMQLQSFGRMPMLVLMSMLPMSFGLMLMMQQLMSLLMLVWRLQRLIPQSQ